MATESICIGTPWPFLVGKAMSSLHDRDPVHSLDPILLVSPSQLRHTEVMVVSDRQEWETTTIPSVRAP